MLGSRYSGFYIGKLDGDILTLGYLSHIIRQKLKGEAIICLRLAIFME